MLDEGIHATVSEIGDAENISKSYVSRTLRLALLAPDIGEDILAGTDQAVMLEQLERPLPMSWEEQQAVMSAGAGDMLHTADDRPLSDRLLRDRPPRTSAPMWCAPK
jgi:hypothetical protein